jgi:hypothetical protein
MTDKQQRKQQKARQAQAKAQRNRDKARQKLLLQRKKLARRRSRNRHQSEKRRADDDGTANPTAYSTMPSQKSNAENAARNSHSAVPAAPKYSTVSARERLYGRRLHRKTSTEGASDAPGGGSKGETGTTDDE